MAAERYSGSLLGATSGDNTVAISMGCGGTQHSGQHLNGHFSNNYMCLGQLNNSLFVCNMIGEKTLHGRSAVLCFSPIAGAGLFTVGTVHDLMTEGSSS